MEHDSSSLKTVKSWLMSWFTSSSQNSLTGGLPSSSSQNSLPGSEVAGAA